MSLWDKLREQMHELGIQRELEDELRKGVVLEANRAERTQQKIARLAAKYPRRPIEGLGQIRMHMDPFWRSLADIRFGRGWQKDPATVRRLLQENPEFKAHYQRKAQVQVDGLRGNSQLSTLPAAAGPRMGGTQPSRA